jgi:hypothetical protein
LNRFCPVSTGFSVLSNFVWLFPVYPTCARWTESALNQKLVWHFFILLPSNCNIIWKWWEYNAHRPQKDGSLSERAELARLSPYGFSLNLDKALVSSLFELS